MALMPLSGQILVATPKLRKSMFEKSLIFICEHHEQGSVGVMINRPTSFFLSYIFEQLGVDVNASSLKNLPLLFGGAIQPERGFVLHRPPGEWRSSLIIKPNEVTLTTSNDIIRALANNTGPSDVIVTLGYSAWEPLQLEDEIKNDYWLVCPYQKDLLYNVAYPDRWTFAGNLMGIDIEKMIFGTGHA
jgi:putative transcriptional regulator